jgi:cysteine sulfinate desulfinase/cysteine desulfurase-like protein
MGDIASGLKPAYLHDIRVKAEAIADNARRQTDGRCAWDAQRIIYLLGGMEALSNAQTAGGDNV